MSLTEAQLQQFSLVFTAPGSPVHDLVASTNDPEADEMARSIWADFRGELVPRLESLGQRDLDPKEFREELHALRGISSQFGLFLLEVLLFAWEKKESDPVGATARYLPASLAIARLSLDVIEDDFPHLKSSHG